MGIVNIMLDGEPHVFTGDAARVILELQKKVELLTTMNNWARQLDAYLSAQAKQLDQLESSVQEILLLQHGQA